MSYRPPLRQVISGASIGNAVEWCDFAAYLAPAFYVVAAAVVSLGTVLTLKESACRPLPQAALVEVAAR